MKFKSNYNPKDNNLVIFVDVDEKEMTEFLRKHYEKHKNEIAVAGFRRGRLPFEVYIKLYSQRFIPDIGYEFILNLADKVSENPCYVGYRLHWNDISKVDCEHNENGVRYIFQFAVHKNLDIDMFFSDVDIIEDVVRKSSLNSYIQHKVMEIYNASLKSGLEPDSDSEWDTDIMLGRGDVAVIEYDLTMPDGSKIFCSRKERARMCCLIG
ncbi:MAG: hypothetical protein LBE09_02030, partial [Christensenellaceae bacterium]|nr:hypothetical protein [Christensenellaceae bacterium]